MLLLTANSEHLQETPQPLDEFGKPFSYLETAPIPLYRNNSPALDKIIFKTSNKRQRSTVGPRQQRFKKQGRKAHVTPVSSLNISVFLLTQLFSVNYLHRALPLTILNFSLQDTPHDEDHDERSPNTEQQGKPTSEFSKKTIENTEEVNSYFLRNHIPFVFLC